MLIRFPFDACLIKNRSFRLKKVLHLFSHRCKTFPDNLPTFSYSRYPRPCGIVLGFFESLPHINEAFIPNDAFLYASNDTDRCRLLVE